MIHLGKHTRVFYGWIGLIVCMYLVQLFLTLKVVMPWMGVHKEVHIVADFVFYVSCIVLQVVQMGMASALYFHNTPERNMDLFDFIFDIKSGWKLKVVFFLLVVAFSAMWMFSLIWAFTYYHIAIFPIEGADPVVAMKINTVFMIAQAVLAPVCVFIRYYDYKMRPPSYIV